MGELTSVEIGMEMLGLMVGMSEVLGKMLAFFQQFQMVVVSTSCQAASASHIASSWLIL